jgi:hypothetical protein
MRTVFLLLLLANLAFFAYGSMLRNRAQTPAPVEHLQLHPEKIRLVAPGEEAQAVPKAPAASTPALSGACLEWGVVAGADVGRAETAIAALKLPESSVQRTVLDASGYWVYLPPAKSKTQLERNLAELSALGVTDYFVVQDATPWRNAISLGIFKAEEAAKSFLAALETKGVKGAVVGRRENFLRQIAYLLREPEAATVARLAELQREFPGTQMKAVACPAPTAALSR